MIKTTHLYKRYKHRRNNFYALRNINLDLPDKGFITILGESGSGKTTFLNCLSGLLPFHGKITIDNATYTKLVDYKLRQNKIARVFQDSFLIQDKTVYDNIKYAYIKKDNENLNEKIFNILSKLQIEKLVNRKVNTLSGGQMQRVAIARALINNPSILLADEPTAHLDKENKTIILNILKELSKNILVILVSHEKTLINKYSDRIITLEKGQIVKDEITNNKELNIKNVLVPNSNKEINKELIQSFNTSTSIKSFIFNKLNITKKSIITLIIFPLLLVLSSMLPNLSTKIDDYMFTMHYKDEIVIYAENSYRFNEEERDYINEIKDEIYFNPIPQEADPISFSLYWDDLIQHKIAQESSLWSTDVHFYSELIDKKYSKELIYGKLPTKITEVIIDYSLILDLLPLENNTHEYLFDSFGLDNAQNFLNAKLAFYGGIVLDIVGISAKYSNCIYCQKDLINYYSYNKNKENQPKLSSNYSYINKEEIGYNDIYLCESIYNELENKETYVLEDNTFNIKGHFSNNDNVDLIINKNRFNDLLFYTQLTNSDALKIIPNDKLNEINENFKTTSYYEFERSSYLSDRVNDNIRIIVLFILSLILTTYILYINIKNDYLYFYNQMILELVLGKSKLSQIGKFILIELSKITIISLLIYALITSSLKPIFDITGKIINLFMLSSTSLLIGYILFFALIILVSLFTLRKIIFKPIGNLKIDFNNF